MKVYTDFVFDMTTGKEISSKSFEYDGEVLLCKGGKSAPAPAPAPEPVQKVQTKAVIEHFNTAEKP